MTIDDTWNNYNISYCFQEQNEIQMHMLCVDFTLNLLQNVFS